MPANSTHLDYDASLPSWLRARDVIAGEDAVKTGGIKYLPRLDSQSDDEYDGYKSRACFFNATSRTADGFLGLLFRRDPEVKLPDRHAGVGGALRVFTDDVDLMGTSLFTFCKGVTGEVLAVGRCGTLIDWAGSGASRAGQQGESRAYVVRYAAEDILNWQTHRINGRNVVTMIALREIVEQPDNDDPFAVKITETVRVLKLEVLPDGGTRYVVEIWVLADGQRAKSQSSWMSNFWSGQKSTQTKTEWTLVETRVPLRLGKPLPLIPFVFHGPRNALPDVDKMPLADIISVNLDHYRLDADYKHGLHYTALPTAWVSGFDKTSELRIGSSTAWVAETPGAVAGFLEFKGHGLSTFENAQNRDERLMAVLGSRMLEDTKRVGETADAIELRQAGENSILMTLALSVSDSITADAGGALVTNASALLLSVPMAVVEHEETRASSELGAAQKDTARELSAKLASLKGIVWVGVAMFLFGLASMFYPPLKVIIGSITTSAAICAGGLALMILPTLIVGNELLILAGVAAAVGLWFLAHRHGQLRGLVDANKNGIDDRLENSETKGDV